MRAVMLDVPEHILEWRRKTGADQWDEMWDGVLHMVPTPTREHQGIEGELEAWLRRWWKPATGGQVYHQINVARPGLGGRWVNDYRVPDLVMALPARFAVIDRNTHFAGGPDVVIEIRTPGDETDEKAPFYAAVGCRELWIVDRDARSIEVRSLDGERVVSVLADDDGWIRSAFGVELRGERDRRLALRLVGRPDSLDHVS